MNRLQWIVLLTAVILLLTMYFGCPTKAPERSKIDQQRLEAATTISLDKLLVRATKSYAPKDLKPILELEQELQDTTLNIDRTSTLKQLSSNWNKLGDFALGGTYAQQVAGLTETDSAWSITGTTYFSCFRKESDTLIRAFCIENAIKAFENAISIRPNDPVHTVNLGLCYVEDGTQPMRGIIILRDAAEKHPDHPLPSLSLGRMSIRTAQYEKAIERFKNVLRIDANHEEAHYWSGIAHKELNNTAEATAHFEKVLAITTNKRTKIDLQRLLSETK